MPENSDIDTRLLERAMKLLYMVNTTAFKRSDWQAKTRKLYQDICVRLAYGTKPIEDNPKTNRLYRLQRLLRDDDGSRSR